MKYLSNLFLVILFLGLVSPSFSLSQENCESSVTERILSLRNNLKTFKLNAAFDPLHPTEPVSKYETYSNGWISYGINSDEVGISGGVLWNWNYVDEHGVQQTIRIIPDEGTGYEVTHESEVVAHLSTIQVLNESEVKKPEYVPVLTKMIAMYKSAKEFLAKLEKSILTGLDGKVTHYEITADGLQFETNFTLKIEENLSTSEITGKYTCRFIDVDRQMNGHYGRDYVYRIDTDELTLGDAQMAAVG